MATEKLQSRGLVVLGAVLIQLSLGAIYAWSVFTPTLKTEGWTVTDTQIVFSVALASFVIVMIWAGRQLTKMGPVKLSYASAIVLGGAYILAGLLGPTSFPVLVLTIGVMGGAGIGLGYVVPIAVGMRWFPDKEGMITGVAVAGFGFGALGWVKAAENWGHLIENVGLDTTFIIYGVAFIILIGVGGTFMKFPPLGWKPKRWKPPKPSRFHKGHRGKVDFTSTQMLKTIQFYQLFIVYVLLAGAGLMAIGLMKLYPMEALTANGYDALHASAIAGTAMAVFYSIFNGVGRIIWGTISDKLGRKISLTLLAVIQGFAIIAFAYSAGSETALYINAAVIGFNFGGTLSLFPTMTADTFGSHNVGLNYPWMFLAYGVGGIFGPIVGGLLGDMGNFTMAFMGCGVLVLLGAVVMFLVKTPEEPESA